MTCQIVIPVQPPEEGKSRLAAVLDAQARAALIERMFRHVLSAAIRSLPAGQVRVVSRSRLLLDIATECGALAVHEQACGLNLALAQAAALCDPTLPLLVLSADLPFLEPEDIAAMLAVQDHADVAVATDRAGQGTNGLYLRTPGLIGFSFGENSLVRHRELARHAGQRFAMIQRYGLATDIDQPIDLQAM
jgi:2-phospho-L-lactate/phosphoenolpyruvate guanylyltransferase